MKNNVKAAWRLTLFCSLGGGFFSSVFAGNKGLELYKTNCVACHGMSGEGNGPAAVAMPEGKKPRNLVKDAFKQGDDLPSIMSSILNGVPGSLMPPWKDFSEADRKHLAEYVLSLRKSKLKK